MDTFTPPSDSPPEPTQTGNIEAGAALLGGLSAFARNLPPLAGAGTSAMLLVLAATLCCLVPVFVVLPVLSWGMYAFLLQAVDGKADVSTVFRPFSERFVEAWWKSALLMLILALLQLPLMVAGGALGLAGDLGLHPMVPTLAVSAVGIVWVLALARLSFAWFLLVERDLSPIDALSTSWSVSSGQWTQIAGIILVGQLLGLPTVVANAWATASLQSADPMQMLEMLGPIYGVLALAAIFGSLLQTWISLSMAVAYRQLFGRP